jgi:hypothetical protein
VKRIYKKFTAALMMICLIVLSAPVAGSAADPTAGMVAHYTFDGDVNDSSGNSNNGTVVGNVTYANDAVSGKSALFDGGYINVDSKTELNIGSKFTISVWVKIDPDKGKSGNNSIVSKLDNNGNYNVYHAYARGDFAARMDTRTNNGELPVASGGFEDFGMDEDWTNLVFSCDGQALYIYKNGTQKALKTVKDGTSIISSDGKMRIGTGNDINNSSVLFKGMMDDLRIYNYGMSASEIKALYDSAFPYNHKMVLQLNKRTMMVDNKQQDVDPGRDTVPVLVSGRTLVPIRAVIEAMGGTIGWTQSDKRVDITLGSKKMQLWINNTKATLNGKELTMDVPPMLLHERTMLPLRFVSENLGSKVDWDGKTQSITISYAK